jgi:hypothetical protein
MEQKESKFCHMEHHPCSKTLRRHVYDNAKKCKQITVKRCKTDPTKKKACDYAKRGISRLRKRELCSYIVGSPVFRSEGYMLPKNLKNVEIGRNLPRTIEQQLFTPKQINIQEREKGSIGDAQRTLYLAQFSGKDTVVYEQKGGSKAYWTNYDEDEEEYLDDWRLTFPSHFDRFVQSAKRKSIKHIFVYLRLHQQQEEDPEKQSTHSNFLLVDLEHGLMYRYEPSGYGKIYDIFDMNELDDSLSRWARNHRLKYIPPWDSCPSQVIGKVATRQKKLVKAEKKESDPGGFCKIWATFMLEQKLKHPEMDMNTLQTHLLQVFKDNKVDMLHFGRKYIERVNQYGNARLKEHGMKKDDDPDEYLEKHWTKLIQSTQ